MATLPQRETAGSTPAQQPSVEEFLRDVLQDVRRICQSCARTAPRDRDDIAGTAISETLLKVAKLYQNGRLDLDKSYRSYIATIAWRETLDEIDRRVLEASRFPHAAAAAETLPDCDKASRPAERALVEDELEALNRRFGARDVTAFIQRHKDDETFEATARDLGYRNLQQAERAIKKIEAYQSRRSIGA